MRCHASHFVGIAILLLAGACAVPGTAIHSEPPPEGPYLVVLGTAQDGGFPQIGADHPRAQAARKHPERRRLVASVLIADPASGRRWLIDATPDIREQVELARNHPLTWSPGTGRPPLFDAVLITHGHMGHYTGLLHMGREAYGAQGQPVWCSAKMAHLLSNNEPWSLLVRLGHVRLRTLVPDQPVPLTNELSITPFLVPHRAELTDTFGFIVEGPQRKILYIPDIDKWQLWDRQLEDVLKSVDVALVDGTFYEDGEIPGRSMADIPHPFIEETLARVAGLPISERRKIVFTHLNHTNTAADPDGTAQARIASFGCRVARDGEIIGL